MKVEKFNLWETTPGKCEEIPTLTVYIPEKKTSDCAIIHLPGGGYTKRSDLEPYGKFFTDRGITFFGCDYRVFPHQFPLPLLDARRAVRTVRYYADKYGIDKNKIVLMGSSAGGHLAALTSTYYKSIEFEGLDDIDKEDFIPNAQALNYPVIKMSPTDPNAHRGSCIHLLGEDVTNEEAREFDPSLNVTERTPICFMWHTFEDTVVPVVNSLDYIKALKGKGINTEMHIFPNGPHGMGIGIKEDTPVYRHVRQWGELLVTWLRFNGF